MDFKVKGEELSNIIQKYMDKYEAGITVEEVGEVLKVGDGIARVSGLPNAMSGEMLEFPHGIYGITFNLEEDNVGVVLLGEDVAIKEGDTVKRTGKIAQVPVGDSLTGRVINPIGEPLDGKGPINSKEFRKVEAIALGVSSRQPVREPLQTGIKAIDAMIPIGRGQR
ncbi:MAG TPA: F0F1 ATP synthase subunit alpha, partial [Candidatus Brocadiales bacterium]|nr:F0F1 ATP synthase subunit alpha [Candidatus Brocadiales bacterium]